MIQSQQKHALRTVHNKDRYYHTTILPYNKDRLCNVWNVYELNLLYISIFTNKIKTGIAAFDTAAFDTTLLTHMQHVSQA